MEKFNNIQDLSVEEIIVKCIHTLTENDNTKVTLNKLLNVLTNYYGAKRVYLFEFELKNKIMSNSYQWFADLIEKINAQSLKMPVITSKVLTDSFDESIATLHCKEFVGNPEWETFFEVIQGDFDTIFTPMIFKNQIVGFVGVEFPTKNITSPLLSSISYLIVEVIAKRRIYDDLERMSYRDAHTNCYNRNKYIEVIKEFNVTPPKKLGIIYADLNGLKSANDKHGHDYGDFIIKKCATALVSSFGDNVYRAGGDEFIVLETEKDSDEFEQLVESLRQFIASDTECNMSLGVVWREGEIDVLKEISYSDELMYIEKKNYYKSMLASKMNAKYNSAKDLLREIELGFFKIYFQSRVDLETGKIVGAETFLRKYEVDGTLLKPDTFIPEYEIDGVIHHLDFFVVTQVCMVLRDLIKKGKEITITVNISRTTFLESDAIPEIMNLCDKYQVPYHYLDIEVTDGYGKIDDNKLSEKVAFAQQNGFSVTMDYFDYHSSNMIDNTKVEGAVPQNIKLDRKLFEKFDETKNQKIVEYIISMCKNMNVGTFLALGVENEEQRELLKEMNCDYGQGYLFAHPVPAEEFVSDFLNQ